MAAHTGMQHSFCRGAKGVTRFESDLVVRFATTRLVSQETARVCSGSSVCLASLPVAAALDERQQEAAALLPLPSLDVSSDSASYPSLHRLRRVRKQTDGLTRMSEEIARLPSGRNMGPIDDPTTVYLSEVILANASDPAQLESVLQDVGVTDGGVMTSRLGSNVLKHLSAQGHVAEGLMFLRWLQVRGYMVQRGAFTALVATLARCGPHQEAEQVFRAMLEPSLHAYTALMQARAQAGRWRDVLAAFTALQAAGFRADTMIYNCAIGACGRAGQTDQVARLWAQMQAEGCLPNTGTMALLLSTFVGANWTEAALEIYFQACFSNLNITRDMYKGIICLLAKQDRWPFAMDIYREARSKALAAAPAVRNIVFFSGPVVFNALISSLSRAGMWREALDIYSDICAFGIQPDQFTWCALASALGRAGEYDQAMALNKDMTEMWGLKPNLEICNAALLACQQKGRWERALQLLWQMESAGISPDVVSFSTAIRACELAGQSAVALRVYRQMLRVPCTPNCFTYGSLIRALGRAKDWKGAMHLFEDMRLGGQEPNIHVYNAMLFALLESKKCVEAYSVLDEMKRYRVKANHQTDSLLHRYGLQCSIDEREEDGDAQERWNLGL